MKYGARNGNFSASIKGPFSASIKYLQVIEAFK